MINTQASQLTVSQLDKKPASRGGSFSVGGDNQLMGTSCLGLSSVPRYTQYGSLVPRYKPASTTASFDKGCAAPPSKERSRRATPVRPYIHMCVVDM